MSSVVGPDPRTVCWILCAPVPAETGCEMANDGKSDGFEPEEVKQRLAKAVSELRDLPELQAQNGVSTLFQVLSPGGPPSTSYLASSGKGSNLWHTRLEPSWPCVEYYEFAGCNCGSVLGRHVNALQLDLVYRGFRLS